MIKNGSYIRIEKKINIDIPEGLSYEEAIEYARQQDAAGNLEFASYIDVMNDDGTVANAAEYNQQVNRNEQVKFVPSKSKFITSAVRFNHFVYGRSLKS